VLLLGPLLVMAGLVSSRALPERGDVLGPGAYAEHPPLQYTGGFGEPTCQACHFGAAVNAGDGTLTVDGLPEAVQAGERYRLTVTLAAAMERSGFMLAVRHLDGRQAGTLAPVDTARVSVGTPDSTAVQYAHHTLAGTTVPGSERTTWTVQWTAPAVPGDSVVVHVAANAANDDASAFGDDVYTAGKRAWVGE